MDIKLATINLYIQFMLQQRGESEATAVQAAEWLQTAGILKDSRHRPGLPLRELLRSNKILGQRQEANRRWFIDRVDLLGVEIKQTAMRG